MPIDRASWRNLWLYEAATGNLLGGTYQNGSLTESNFISAIDIILLVANDEWTVVNRSSGRTVQHTASAIQPGIYDVHSRSKSSYLLYNNVNFNSTNWDAWQTLFIQLMKNGLRGFSAIASLVETIGFVMQCAGEMGDVWSQVSITSDPNGTYGQGLRQHMCFLLNMRAFGWVQAVSGGSWTWMAGKEMEILGVMASTQSTMAY